MPLAPGPFRLQADNELPWQLGTYDFTQFTDENLVDLDTIGAAIDALLPDLLALGAEDLSDLVNVDIDGALATIDTWEQSALSPNWDDMIAAVYDGDQLLQAAFDASPPEAFIAPTGPFIPPTDQLTLSAPTVPPSLYSPGSTAGVGGAPATGGTPASGQTVRSVSLINATTGSTNYKVGDNFTATITGNPGDDVTVHAAINAEDLGYTSYGQLDLSGKLSITGTVQASDVGAWVESWFVGGQFIANYSFVVTPY